MGQKEATIIKAYVRTVISKGKRNQTPAEGTKANISLFQLHELHKPQGDSTEISPRLHTTSRQCNHSPTSALLLPARVYRDTGATSPCGHPEMPLSQNGNEMDGSHDLYLAVLPKCREEDEDLCSQHSPYRRK